MLNVLSARYGRHRYYRQTELAHYWPNNGTLAISTQTQTDSSHFQQQSGIIALEISYAIVIVPLNLS